MPLGRVLEPAVRLARAGVPVSQILSTALMAQRTRLQRGGAEQWILFDQCTDAVCPQLQLATLLERVGEQGRAAFYEGASAQAIARRVQELGGALAEVDLALHATVVSEPIESTWGDWRIATQPPMAQGILLNMALNAWQRLGALPMEFNDHVAIELTQAAFAFRDEIASGDELLMQPLAIDLEKASHRGGPRAYLHTAGVAAADASGSVVSSLVSVFDDFGSCVFVPELGITLNNRAGGFTAGANAPAPGRRPVHTLAPLLLKTPQGVMALATPGADGQVQTLLQVLIALKRDQISVADAIARPRWRSENGRLLIERSHSNMERLAALGHVVAPLADGDLRFGAVVCAGCVDGELMAVADWRRQTAAGAA
jgi:gamma-glutamyltranspeptidase/glutathione hydrolase